MMKNLCKYLVLLAGIFILVHTAVPHHHHADHILFEENTTEEHHHSGESLDEQVIGAATDQQVVEGQLAVYAIAPSPTTCFISNGCVAEKLHTAIPAYYISNYSYFVCSSGGLRAPPVC